MGSKALKRKKKSLHAIKKVNKENSHQRKVKKYSPDLQNGVIPMTSSLTPLTTVDMNKIESSSQLKKINKESTDISSSEDYTPLLPADIDQENHDEILLPVNINSEDIEYEYGDMNMGSTSNDQLKKINKESTGIFSTEDYTSLLPADIDQENHDEILLPVNINSEDIDINMGSKPNDQLKKTNKGSTDISSSEDYTPILPADIDQRNATAFDLAEPCVVEKETDSHFIPVDGRRIVDINYLFAQLQEKGHHNELFECKSAYFKLVGERRMGLLSKFKFICDVCKKVVVINSEKDKDTENVNANIAATTGIVSAGIGYSQFEEILSAMNIPIFSSKFYGHLQDQVYEKWEEIAAQSMEAAAEREKEAAIAEGRVVNGIPIVDVFVDGCWCARSYGTNFKALSGAAVIIGKKFGEVLFMGVKNKYCLICARAEKQGVSPREHTCFKNYSGSSSSMESDIIVEGFKSSLMMYGMAYSRVIADGDASTYNKILKEDPYKSLGIVVEKIECKNHILRNFCKKMRAVTKETKYPLKCRKTLNDSKIMKMRKYIVLSMLHHNQTTDKPKSTCQTLLHNNIQNSVAHAYGDHRLCQNYNCSMDRNESSEFNIIQNTTFLFRINAIVATAAGKSRSLIENVDTNTVERFNSVIAKIVGGKRINFAQRRGYQGRCSAAVVSFNDESAISSVQKSFLGKSPRGKIKDIEKKRTLKRKLNMEHPVRKVRKYRASSKPQHDYGPNSSAPDMTVEEMEKAKQSFFTSLEALVSDRDRIERSTVLQRDSSEWLEIRKKIITASNFGPICKRQPAKDTSPLVKNIIYKKNLAHIASVAHGVENESQALQKLEVQESIKIEPCGLFVDRTHAFIGASPDGLVGDDGLVEVKCPISAHKLGLTAAIQTNKINILHYNKKTKTTTVKKTSNWFFQVQGQLHVTQRKFCLFGIWAGPNEPMHVEHIIRDDLFWETKMLPKIMLFYKNCLLPEIIDPRYTRGMDLRKTNLAGIVLCAPELKNQEVMVSNNEPINQSVEDEAIPQSVEDEAMPLQSLEHEAMLLQSVEDEAMRLQSSEYKYEAILPTRAVAVEPYDTEESELEYLSISRIYDFNEF